MYFVHVRVSRRVIGQDDRFCQGGHVSKREAMPEIVTKKRISRRKAMFREKKVESVGVVRMWDVFKD